MFFSVSTSIDPRFPNNYQIDNLWVNCDDGWQSTGTTFYKGYNNNFCRIIVNSNGADIQHSEPRSFPLWYSDGIVTNIDSDLTRAWADDSISMDTRGKVTIAKTVTNLAVPSDNLTVARAVNLIKQRLDAKLSRVPDNIKLFCSGGLDTLLLYSMLSNCRPFELIVDEHYEQDTFTNNNQSLLTKFWGYNQIHHWTSPTWLATGSHGDEYFLRGPVVISMLTAWHEIDIKQLIADNPECYHYHYFNKYSKLWTDDWDNRHQLQEKYPTIELLHQQIMNILANDHQHWHLGNTLTWTPFKDIEIVRILLQCSITDLIPQFLAGQLSKELIVSYNPEIIDFLSQYKNINAKENLPKLLEYHLLHKNNIK